MKGWLAIVNPFSGGRRGEGPAALTEPLCSLAERIAYTQYPGHAGALARDAHSYAGVVAVGGDGTVMEVLNGIDRGSQRLAVVPAGRGNSLARDLGVRDSASVLEAMERDTFTALDLMDVTLGDNSGRVIHLLSASTVGVGYPVNVAAIANRLKWLRGNCYIAGAVAASIGTPLFDCEIAYDGAPARQKGLTGLMLNNTRHVANFVAFPEARLDDGYFHAIEASAGALRQNLHNFSAASRLNFYSSARPQKLRDARIRFAFPLDILIDGEIFKDVIALEVRIAPRALHCLRGAAQ